nr:unnamed protein product [Callosobruchus chinensis]
MESETYQELLDLLTPYIEKKSEAHQHEEQYGVDVVIEASPVIDLEGSHEGSYQHKKYSARSKDGTTHQKDLVADIGHRYVVVYVDPTKYTAIDLLPDRIVRNALPLKN